LLCVAGGSADAIAYLRFGTFVGAMTGNTVLIGIDAAEGNLDRGIYHVCIVAVFLFAVIATRAALNADVLVMMPLVLTAIMLAGRHSSPADGAPHSAPPRSGCRTLPCAGSTAYR